MKIYLMIFGENKSFLYTIWLTNYKNFKED